MIIHSSNCQKQRTKLLFLLTVLGIAAASGLTSGCSTGGGTSSSGTSTKQRMGSDPQTPNQAAAAAYAADGFMFSKTQTIREPSSIEFFFKHCTGDDGKVAYSKTSYNCEYP